MDSTTWQKSFRLVLFVEIKHECCRANGVSGRAALLLANQTSVWAHKKRCSSTILRCVGLLLAPSVWEGLFPSAPVRPTHPLLTANSHLPLEQASDWWVESAHMGLRQAQFIIIHYHADYLEAENV
uniref:Uncharacterized protein n=1 Tax=Nothobranchius furzeri TaxID=105023 RepID=A0A8C6P5K7_NOTFU